MGANISLYTASTYLNLSLNLINAMQREIFKLLLEKKKLIEMSQ